MHRLRTTVKRRDAGSSPAGMMQIAPCARFTVSLPEEIYEAVRRHARKCGAACNAPADGPVCREALLGTRIASADSCRRINREACSGGRRHRRRPARVFGPRRDLRHPHRIRGNRGCEPRCPPCADNEWEPARYGIVPWWAHRSPRRRHRATEPHHSRDRIPNCWRSRQAAAEYWSPFHLLSGLVPAEEVQWAVRPAASPGWVSALAWSETTGDRSHRPGGLPALARQRRREAPRHEGPPANPCRLASC